MPSLYATAASSTTSSLLVLDTALRVAILALAAAWPELHTEHFPRREPRAALDVIEHARDLGLAVRRYRRASRPRLHDARTTCPSETSPLGRHDVAPAEGDPITKAARSPAMQSAR